MNKDTPSDTPVVASPRRWFYVAALVLMLAGAAAAFVQKGRESAAAQTTARRVASGVQQTDADRNTVGRIIEDAHCWAHVSFAAVFSAIVSWGVAVVRREKLRWAWAGIVVLFAFYFLLELIIV
jgi:hypothetical protein